MEAESPNGRITLAVIGTKLDLLATKLDSYIAQEEHRHELHEERLRCLEQGQETRKTQIKNMEDDMDDLRGRVNAWNGINSIGAAVAAAIAFFK